jgi:hypothetical protein
MLVTTNKRELAHRVSDGVSVSLFWESVGDSILIEVYDERGGDYFELPVPRDQALEAFRHPYVYRALAEASVRRASLSAAAAS